uniref:Uncharacterized protein n=1 Tax=Oryza nivara TaxID=4536 RepID=A0A0E0FID9_ORYNI
MTRPRAPIESSSRPFLRVKDPARPGPGANALLYNFRRISESGPKAGLFGGASDSERSCSTAAAAAVAAAARGTNKHAS